jgi:hypothetical protein
MKPPHPFFRSFSPVYGDRHGKRKLYAKATGTASISFAFGDLTKTIDVTVAKDDGRHGNEDSGDNESKQDKPDKPDKKPDKPEK